MKKRLFSMLLVLCLCAWLVPAGAEEGTSGEPQYKHVEPPVAVSTYDAMAAALPGGEAEPDADNIVWISHAKLTQSLTLTEGQSIHTLGKLEIPADVTLTISNGATVEAEVEIQSGGEVKVEAGGTLATTMAGENAISNAGTITVYRGGALKSQMGGHVVNKENATLTLNGVFYCNSYYDTTSSEGSPWFSNRGNIKGNGQIVVLKVLTTERNDDDDENVPDTFGNMTVSATMTEKVKNQLGSSSDIEVFTQAENIKDLVDLSSNESSYSNVTGIFLSKELEENAQRNTFTLTNSLEITKNLWLDEKTDLCVGGDATLTVDKDKLLFSGRGNLSVAPGGGTLKLGDLTLFGGSGTEAAFVPTSNRIFLSAMSPDAVGPDHYPAAPEWIYLLGDATSKAGTDIKNLGLHLIVDFALTLEGNFSADSVEVRGELTAAEDAAVSIADLNYGANSSENTLKGTKSTSYELDFDLNSNNGYDDIYDHLAITDGKIYLQKDGNSVPVSPTRSGYTFNGWTATSHWTNIATSDKLAAITVQTDENGAYVPAPTEFPVLMTAQWTRNSSGGGGTVVKPETPPSETVTSTDQAAADGAVALTATVTDDTAVVTLSDTEIDRVAGGEEETSLVLDVSGLSKPVSAVTLETAALEKIADAAAAEDSALDGLTVKLTDCAVTLDAEALEAVADQAGGKTVTLAVDVNAENLTDFQKNVVAELDNAVVLDIYLVSDGKRISDFHDGKATLEIPYQWDGEGVLRAVFVRDDGSLEVVPVSWSDGVATVTVGHFSHYAIFTEEALPFMDVTDPLSYYYDAVKWALDQQITAGTTDTTFSPDAACTRAQMVTFLWRAAGTPEPVGTSNPFADVSPDAYYRKAVLWAAENGITAGTSEAAFSPDMTCTRAQMAAFLHRFAGTPASEGTMPFADVSPDAYYHDAVLWAANCGVTTGTSATTFSPNDPCSRGQIVTFLYRSA